MTGFSAQWLALREPADHAARNPALVASLRSALGPDRAGLRITDLGCGAGSNLRALMPALAQPQHWLCVDYDQALLDEAARLNAPLAAGGTTISYLRADLNSQLGEVLDRGADLVTAAAFFDLWSLDAIAGFCEQLARRRLPLYTVLTYNGLEEWLPPHPADPVIHAAFVEHQLTDKGFGAAAGPHASLALISGLQTHGYDVEGGESPWALGPDQRGLIAMLAEGIASAVSETGAVDQAVIDGWLQDRRNATCRIGHMDILAVPGN